MTDQPPQFSAPQQPIQPPNKPWYKKPGCLIPLILVVLMVLFLGSCTAIFGAAVSNSGDDAQKAAPTVTIYPGRADAQKEDQEREIGKAAEISGYTSTVTAAGFEKEIGAFQSNGYIVADVTINNRDSKAQPYNPFDWKLQTPAGQVVDPGLVVVDGALSSGDLVSGGSVSGKVAFEVGTTKGDFYLIYKPDPFDAARGIWKVTVS